MNSQISITALSDKTVWESLCLYSSRLESLLHSVLYPQDEWAIYWLENIPISSVFQNEKQLVDQNLSMNELLETELKQIQEEDYINSSDEDETEHQVVTSPSISSIPSSSSEQEQQEEEQLISSSHIEDHSNKDSVMIDEHPGQKTTSRVTEKKSQHTQIRIPYPPMITLIFISSTKSISYLAQVPKVFFDLSLLRCIRSIQFNHSSNHVVCVSTKTSMWNRTKLSRYSRAKSIEENSAYYLQSALTHLYQVISTGASTDSSVSNNITSPPRLILVILLRSGRFAMALFDIHAWSRSDTTPNPIKNFVLYHTTSARYTTRRGQGGAQSSKDSQKSVKSIGSQLRRMGEVQLRQDVQNAFQDMLKGIKRPDLFADDSSVLDLLHQCQFIFWSVSKSLLSHFWEDANIGLGNKNFKVELKGQKEFHHLFHSKNPKMKSIPIDYGRPSYQTCCEVLERLFLCYIQDPVHESWLSSLSTEQPNHSINQDNIIVGSQSESISKEESNEKTLTSSYIPLTPLHEAARDCDWKRLSQLLELQSIDDTAENDSDTKCDTTVPMEAAIDINTKAGPNLMTPLHFASSAVTMNPNDASKCVSILLEQCGADPSIRDLNGCLPYSVASYDCIRIAFRRARGNLGETMSFDWDVDAKVGPPITDESEKLKRQKASDKKRRQRQNQKERKHADQLRVESEEKAKREEIEKKKNEEEAKRVRAGLSPKLVAAPNSNDSVCDFCQTLVKGKRRSQLFSRLDFAYCSMECVKQHQRELAASAALSRFSSSS